MMKQLAIISLFSLVYMASSLPNPIDWTNIKKDILSDKAINEDVVDVENNQIENNEHKEDRLKFHIGAKQKKWYLEEKKAKTVARAEIGVHLYRRKRWTIKALWGEEEEEEESADRARLLHCQATCWAEWQKWTTCTTRCGNGGITTRTRSALTHKDCHCPGSNYQEKACNRDKCLNGGTAAHRNSCDCRSGYTGLCCQEEVTCANPGVPSHSIVSPGGSIHDYGTTVQYSCNEGYQLTNGNRHRTCQQDGTWTGQIPQCERRMCDHPGVPRNGHAISSAVLVYESLVQFTCEVGFFLKGSETTTCLSNGLWSDPLPICDKGGCGDPGVPNHGHRIGSNYMFDDIVTYECDEGYVLVGSAERRCQADGRWSCEEPRCLTSDSLMRKCAVLDEIPNGNIVTTQGYLYQSIAMYSCKEGYYLDGHHQRACQIEEKWSGRVPTCKAILCEPLPDPIHGHVVQPGGLPPHGSKAVFTCSHGHKLLGDAERLCTGDSSIGIWSGTQPSCQAINCGSPNSPTNGRIIGYSYVWGDPPLRVECGPGFYLKGSSELTCSQDAVWVGNQEDSPICIECPLNEYSTQVGPTASCTTCPNNTETRFPGSSDIRQCLCIEGYHGPEGGPCQVIRCDAPPVPSRVIPVDTCDFGYGSTCNFDCQSGHVRYLGDTSRTCAGSGQWTGDPLQCAPCPKDSYKYGDMCSACPANSQTLGIGSSRIDCVPLPGYRFGTGDLIEDINECQDNNTNPCVDKELCVNTPGDAYCRCPVGSIQDGTSTNQQPIRCITEEERCPSLVAPLNGELQCVKSGEVESCMPYCDSGHEFPDQFDVYVFCGPETDYRWSHILAGKTMPDCVTTVFGNPSVTGILAYPGGECVKLSDNQKQTAVNEFLDITESQGICYKEPGHQCEMMQAKTVCLDDADADAVLKLKRKRRNVSSDSGISFNFTFKIEPFIDPEIYSCQDKICREKYESLLEFSLSNVISRLEYLVENCDLCLEKTDGTTLQPIIITDSRVNCPPGAVQKSLTKRCVCQALHYYNKDLQRCVPFQQADVGQYEEIEHQEMIETFNYDCNGTNACTEANLQAATRFPHVDRNKYIECNPDNVGQCRIVTCPYNQVYSDEQKRCI